MPVCEAGQVCDTNAAIPPSTGAEQRPQVTSETRQSRARLGQAFPVSGIELRHVPLSKAHQELLALMRAVETGLSCCMP